MQNEIKKMGIAYLETVIILTFTLLKMKPSIQLESLDIKAFSLPDAVMEEALYTII
jgi:hypothetical protein